MDVPIPDEIQKLTATEVADRLKDFMEWAWLVIDIPTDQAQELVEALDDALILVEQVGKAPSE